MELRPVPRFWNRFTSLGRSVRRLRSLRPRLETMESRALLDGGAALALQHGLHASFSAGAAELFSVPNHRLQDMGAAGQHAGAQTALARRPRQTFGAAPSQYIGLSFQPYVKQWGPNKSLAFFNSYGTGDASVTKQIALISSTTNKVATYSAGYAPYYPVDQPFNKLDSTWQVASASAQLNKSRNALAMTVSQGVFQKTNDDGTLNPTWMNAEITDAFAIVANANGIYPGTVTRMIFTNEYLTSAANTTAVDQMVNANKDKAHGMGIKVGVRAETFGQLTNSQSPLQKPLKQLVSDVDFIMLNLYPSNADLKKGPAAAALAVGAEYQRIKKAATQVNPNVQVLMGETGWPSQGISFNDLSGKSSTVANEKAYLTAFNAWATKNKVESYPFEAIDEPWKSNMKQPLNAPQPWKGPKGAEGHFGIWTYNSTNDTGKFVAKFTL